MIVVAGGDCLLIACLNKWENATVNQGKVGKIK